MSRNLLSFRRFFSAKRLPVRRRAHRPMLELLEDRLAPATYNVTGTADGLGAVKQTGPGVFDATTLRAAVIAANAAGGRQTIQLPSGYYELSLEGANEDNAKTGDLDVRCNVTVVGNGSTIHGDGLDRVFQIIGKTTAVTLADLTLENGKVVTTGTAAAQGGAVYNAGQLTLTNVTINANVVGFLAQGGAVYNAGGASLTGTGDVTWGGQAKATNGADGDAPGKDGKDGGTAQGGVVYNDGGTVTLKSISLYGYALGGDGGSGAAGVDGADGAPGAAGGNGTKGGNGGRGGNAEGGGLYNAGGTVMLQNPSGVGYTAAGKGGTGADGGKGGHGGHGTKPGMAGGTGGNAGAGGNGGAGGRAAGGLIDSSGGALTITNADPGRTFTAQAVGGDGNWGGQSGLYAGNGGNGADGATTPGASGGAGSPGGRGGNNADAGNGGDGGAALGGIINVEAGTFFLANLVVGASNQASARGGSGGVGAIANVAGNGGIGGSGGNGAAIDYGAFSGGGGAAGAPGGNGGKGGSGGKGGDAQGAALRLARGVTSATITDCTITGQAQGGQAGSVYYGGPGGAGGAGGSGGVAVSSAKPPDSPKPAAGGAGSSGANGGNAGRGGNGGVGGSATGGGMFSAAVALTIERTTFRDCKVEAAAGEQGGLAGWAGAGGVGGSGGYGAAGGKTGAGAAGAAGGNAASHGDGGVAGAALGAGLYVTGGVLRNCTFANNTATAQRGGAAGIDSPYFGTRGHAGDGGLGGSGNPDGSAGSAGSTANPALSGTDGNGSGGGIEVVAGTVVLINNTIVGNKVTGPNVARVGGGGIAVLDGTARIQNTIVARNSGIAPNDDVSGAFATDGHNLIGVGIGASGFDPLNKGDLVGTAFNPIDPRLESLPPAGAYPAVLTPLPDSPVINAGDNNNVPAQDALGQPRVQGGVVDIGAVEAKSTGKWTPLGPAPLYNGQTRGTFTVSGRATAVVADPDNPDIVYMTAAGGGVWKTTNASAPGGPDWKPLLEIGTVDWAGAPPVQFTGALTIARNPSAANDPAQRILYVGTGEANNNADRGDGYGILVSRDSGLSWKLLRGNGDGKGNWSFDRSAFSKIVVVARKDKPDLIFAAGMPSTSGSSFQRGVWRSPDGGTTWENTTTGLALPTGVNATAQSYSDLVSNPTNPNLLYVAAGNDRGSQANGVWYATNADAPAGTTLNWVRSPGFPTGVTDKNLGRIQLGLSTDGKTFYASVANAVNNFGTFYQLWQATAADTPAAVKWAEIGQKNNMPNYLGNQGFYDTALAVDPSNANTVYAGGQGGNWTVLRVDNAGQANQKFVDLSGETANRGPHADHHGLFVDNKGRLLDANDGGIARLDNARTAAGDPNAKGPDGKPKPVDTTQWVSLSGNLQITQFRGIALHPTDVGVALGGSQDNGTEKLENGRWFRNVSSDGGPVRIDPHFPNVVYRNNGKNSVNNFKDGDLLGLIQRSDDGGATWVAMPKGALSSADAMEGYPPYVLDASDPSKPARLYLATDKLYVADNRGVGGWTLPAVKTDWTDPKKTWPKDDKGNTIRPQATALAVAGDGKTVYVAAGTYIYVSADGGADWSTSDTFQTDHIADIVVDPQNPTVAYAVRADFNRTGTTGQVFKTADGGKSWADITVDLGFTDPSSGRVMEVPAYAVALVKGDGGAFDRLYVGTTSGLFSSPVAADGSVVVSWTLERNGLPQMEISDLEYNSSLRLLAAGSYGRGLWALNLGTQPLKLGETPPRGPQVFFAATHPLFGRELWRTDGTEAGTVLVKDINPSGNSNPQALTRVGKLVYFTADDGVHGRELWVSDGTNAGTRLLKDITPGAGSSSFLSLTAAGNALYFLVGNVLWKADPTKNSVTLVSQSAVGPLFWSGTALFFQEYVVGWGQEVFVTTGNSAASLKDLNPGPASCYVADFTLFGGKVYFTAVDGHGRNIWRTDGTTKGTTPLLDWSGVSLADMARHARFPTNSSGLTVVGNTLYFLGTQGPSGEELWKTNGTEAGTVLVKDINPGKASSGITYKTNVNNLFYFIADNGANGRQLWRTDGTGAGTERLTTLAAPGGNPAFADLTASGADLYFSAVTTSGGRELYRYFDKTLTPLDINPGKGDGYVVKSPPAVLAGKLIFAAGKSADDIELWVSNGTPGGTKPIKDIFAGPKGSGPDGFVQVDL